MQFPQNCWGSYRTYNASVTLSACLLISGGVTDFPVAYGEKWSMETHTRTEPTDAYGDLEFNGYDDTGRKVVVLSYDTRHCSVCQ